MPRFSYQYQPADLTNAITALMTQGGAQSANALMQAAQLQAQGTMGAGQAWGQGLAQLGQTPTTYMNAIKQRNYQNMVSQLLGGGGGNVGMAPMAPALSPTDYYSLYAMASPLSTGTFTGDLGTVVGAGSGMAGSGVLGF